MKSKFYKIPGNFDPNVITFTFINCGKLKLACGCIQNLFLTFSIVIVKKTSQRVFVVLGLSRVLNFNGWDFQTNLAVSSSRRPDINFARITYTKRKMYTFKKNYSKSLNSTIFGSMKKWCYAKLCNVMNKSSNSYRLYNRYWRNWNFF